MGYTPTITLVAGPDAESRFDAAVANYGDARAAVASTFEEVRAALRRDVDYIAARRPDQATVETLVAATETGHAVMVLLDGAYTEAAAWLAAHACTYPSAVTICPLSDYNVHHYPDDTVPLIPTPSPAVPEQDLADRVLAALPDRYAPRLRKMVRPFARMVRGDGAPAGPTSSYVGGHPFVPGAGGRPWPTDGDGDPMVFVCQVNFADVPPLDGYPTTGLLQWFVAADNCYGLTFDQTQGLVGFVARWYDADELNQPAAATPHAPQPLDAAGTDFLCTPLNTWAPVPVTFTADAGLPGPNDEVTDQPGHFDDYGSIYEMLGDLLPEDAFDEDPYFALTSRVGGHPGFAQGDPRRADRADGLLIQLGSEDNLATWGDLGTAQLFGDPAALARGDLSSLWWDWACG